MKPGPKPVTVMKSQEVAQTDRSLIDVESDRAIQQVQAAVLMAKKYPRDEALARERIKKACQRKGLAEQSAYEYERGGSPVRGPSIRLAEAIAQNWGNLDFGIAELSRERGESVMLAYAWDIETNTRQTKTFNVRHWRDTKQGGYELKDERDIYEITANNGARRLRACILGVIPGDVVDEAMDECEATLTARDKSKPLPDRLKVMLNEFAQFKVTQAIIESKFKRSADSLTEADFASLRRIYQTLKDGIQRPEDAFEIAPPAPSRTQLLNQEPLKPKVEPQPKPLPAPVQQPEASSFDSYETGSLFNRKPVETIESLQEQVGDLVDQLRMPGEEFNAIIQEMFKCTADDLGVTDLRQLRDRLKNNLQRGR